MCLMEENHHTERPHKDTQRLQRENTNGKLTTGNQEVYNETVSRPIVFSKPCFEFPETLETPVFWRESERQERKGTLFLLILSFFSCFTQTPNLPL